MAYSIRMFVFGPDDALYRLPSARFTAMLEDGESYRSSRFAGRRVRMAEAIVEIQNRVPRRVVRLTYDTLRFDADGRLDRKAFERHQAARAELALFEPERDNSNIVHAKTRFVAQGGRWVPSPSLERLVNHAALGKIRCRTV